LGKGMGMEELASMWGWKAGLRIDPGSRLIVWAGVCGDWIGEASEGKILEEGFR